MSAAMIPSFASAAAEKDYPLENYIGGLKKLAPNPNTKITLSAVGAVKNGQLMLSFHLKNVSASPITMWDALLPWGFTYSIRFVALTPKGRVLPMGYLIDDPVRRSVTIAPGESLHGDYNLSNMLMPGSIPPDTDIVVLWSYLDDTAKSDKNDKDGLLTGVAVIHTPKARK